MKKSDLKLIPNKRKLGWNFSIWFTNIFNLGGTEDLEYLPIPKFRKGMEGCVGELSIGRVYAIDMIQKAKTGRNVDTCHDYNNNNGSK